VDNHGRSFQLSFPQFDARAAVARTADSSTAGASGEGPRWLLDWIMG